MSGVHGAALVSQNKTFLTYYQASLKNHNRP